MAQTPSEWMEEAVGEDGNVKSLTTIAKKGIGGWLLALFASIISGMQSVFDILIVPLNAIADSAEKVVEAFVLEPLGIVETAATATGTATTDFGLFALPVGTGVVMLVFGMVALYLAIPETGNLLPPYPYDFPTPLFEDPEEEDDEG